MYEKIVEILAKHLMVDPKTISEDTDIVEELGADSLDIVEITMDLEQTFGLSVPDEKIADFKTPKDILNYIVEEKN